MVAEERRKADRRHSEPCADIVEVRQVCRGLVEDRQRMNGSISRIEGHIGELHEKVNSIILLNERETGTLKAIVAGLALASDVATIRAEFASVARRGELETVRQDMATLRLEMQRTLAAAGWKIIAAMFSAGLAFGGGLTLFVLGRLIP